MFLSCHVRVSEWMHTLNGWVFVYELSGYGFESCCSHFKELYCVKGGPGIWITEP